MQIPKNPSLHPIFSESNQPKVKEVMPAPLSQFSFSGMLYVYREDKKPVRLNELAADYPENHLHRLMSPIGPRDVRIQIGAFRTATKTLVFRDGDGKEVKFFTTCSRLRIREGVSYDLSVVRNAVYMGAQYLAEGEIAYEDLYFEKQRDAQVEHYSYSMTPGPIFLGARQGTVFLPFEVV